MNQIATTRFIHSFTQIWMNEPCCCNLFWLAPWKSLKVKSTACMIGYGTWQFDGRKRVSIDNTKKVSRICMSTQHKKYSELGVEQFQQLFRSLFQHLSYRRFFELKAIWSTPTCRFNRHQLVDSINMLVSCWSTTAFWQQHPLMLNWTFEKSIATIIIFKLLICKIHWKQLNTRLLVENSTCKLLICTKLDLSTLCFHWKYSFSCNFKFYAGLGSSCHPTPW